MGATAGLVGVGRLVHYAPPFCLSHVFFPIRLGGEGCLVRRRRGEGGTVGWLEFGGFVEDGGFVLASCAFVCGCPGAVVAGEGQPGVGDAGCGVR